MKSFSIVIPHYNDLRILECIKSIQKQDYPKDKIEILIQDNFSQKEILDEINCLLDTKDKLFLQKDKGIFDALDKCYQRANNDYILSIGADDEIIDDKFFSNLNDLFSNNNFELIIVGVIYTNASRKVIRKWPIRKFNLLGKLLGFQYPHFGTIAKKEIFQNFKFYNEELLHNNDYNFFLNLDHKTAKVGYLDSYAINLGFGGNSSATLTKILKINFDLFLYLLRNNTIFSFGMLLKPFYKIYEILLAIKNPNDLG